MGKFLTEIGKVFDEILTQQDLAYQRWALRVYNQIIISTPVDKGPHRQSWYIVKGTQPGPLIEGDAGPSPDLAIISTLRVGDAFTIYNAQGVSAIVIELGLYTNPGQPHKRKISAQPEILTTPQGYSIQAPQGMIGVNIPLFNEWLAEEQAEGLRRARGAA